MKCAFGTICGTLNFTAPKEQLHYAARHNFTAACRNFTFEEHPDYKRKFDTAEIKLPLTITNCWIDLPEEKEDEFRTALKKLPTQYTMDDFWKVAKQYKKYISKPPARYLLNLTMTHPWDKNKNANMVYSEWELIKN